VKTSLLDDFPDNFPENAPSTGGKAFDPRRDLLHCFFKDFYQRKLNKYNFHPPKYIMAELRGAHKKACDR
jgi:hypothetical protein